MLKVVHENVEKKIVQSRVVQMLQKSDYSLNIVNRYKENILHISAANDCLDIVKFIIEKNGTQYLGRKNSFGWTPLMQAIRNENIETVKFLLKSGANVNDFSFLGLSTLSLATAISTEVFDILYNNCPTALESAAHDDINPLCIAALKNDKELFFKLVGLGLDYTKANAFTQIMMKNSKVPEISSLAKTHYISENYWNDLSSIEELLKIDEEEELNFIKDNFEIIQQKSNSKGFCLPEVVIEQVATANRKGSLKHFRSRLSLPLIKYPDDEPESLISPTLAYVRDTRMPNSPTNTCFINEEDIQPSCKKIKLDVDNDSAKSDDNNNINNIEKNRIDNNKKQLVFDFEVITKSDCKSPLVLRRCQHKRPPNLSLRKSSTDSNTTLSFTPQFSPMKTPNLPPDVNEDNVFDESTPTPPKYQTPPRGIILDPSASRLMFLLQRFGLKRHIPIFLEQEVDMDLFLTLNEGDLIEIGIENKSERLILLSVINECRGKDL